MNNSKKWSCGMLLLTFLALAFLGGITVYVDPYFHYHAPQEGLTYPIDNERYQNDGISKHFTYDAMITGSSMTENFRVSDMNQLFGVNAIKIPYSGTTYREIGDSIERAIQANPDLKVVVRSLDRYFMSEGKDDLRTDVSLPTYLYDSNPFNDVSYLFNKTVLFSATAGVLEHTKAGNATTSFDDYAFWGDKRTYGPEETFGDIYWDGVSYPYLSLSESDAQRIEANYRQNVADLAERYPDVTFYCFYPPYSLVCWSQQHIYGGLGQMIEAYERISEMLLEYDNIRLYSFCSDYETIENLDNYKDIEHYAPDINAKILRDMAAGNFLLTKENNKAHWQDVLEHYSSYDYITLYETHGRLLQE